MTYIGELISIGVDGLKETAMSYELGSDMDFKKHAVSMMRQCLEEAVAKK